MIKKLRYYILIYLVASLVIGGVVFLVGYPPFFWAKLSNFFSGLFYYPVTLVDNIFFSQNEIRQLKKENAQLKIQTANLLALQEENEFLKKALELQPFKGKLIPARILFFPLDNKNQAYISVGSDQGMVEGLPIVVGPSILVGKIIEVSQLKSKIAFSTDNEFASSAVVPGLNVKAIAKGNGKLIIATLPSSSESKKILPGMLVLSGSLDPLTPPRLTLGKIISIKEDKKINTLNLEIEPALSPDQISDIFIIK
ncbi:MAG: rod shape-determining protein MreC [candidate division WOR-3 bacterium]